MTRRLIYIIPFLLLNCCATPKPIFHGDTLLFNIAPLHKLKASFPETEGKYELVLFEDEWKGLGGAHNRHDWTSVFAKISTDSKIPEVVSIWIGYLPPGTGWWYKTSVDQEFCYLEDTVKIKEEHCDRLILLSSIKCDPEWGLDRCHIRNPVLVGRIETKEEHRTGGYSYRISYIRSVHSYGINVSSSKHLWGKNQIGGNEKSVLEKFRRDLIDISNSFKHLDQNDITRIKELERK